MITLSEDIQIKKVCLKQINSLEYCILKTGYHSSYQSLNVNGVKRQKIIKLISPRIEVK